MKKSAQMLRDVCQPKFKISDEVANGIKDGIVPDEQNVKCYINCVLEMMNSIKKGKLNYEASVKQIDLLLPDRLKDSFKAGLAACRNSIDGIRNHCEAATVLLKCLKANIPEFFFP
ncbi:unnamed protein product [Hermetia illucens]|uniref:Uncharacterized protein n=2 Tax=Hermetia illucens TaxID=343691 RepID=A0A7R8UU72_HERIL|nr:unnamed protein product [Hermetia illucens]